jgi:hypothetical protein
LNNSFFAFGRSSDLFFRFNAFPISQWQKYFEINSLSAANLQQRVCSGFSPDSLFNEFSKRYENSSPKLGQR